MSQYNVYLSGQPRVIEANSNDTLQSLRRKLGSDGDNYDFVYFNDFTGKKTVLADRSVESRQTINKITFDTDTLIMAVTKGDKTDLFGMRTDWMNDRHMGVQIILNNNDDDARQQNAGKFEPIMLTDVQPTNPSSNAFYSRAVICEKGSVVQFNISSWGAAGFGYNISSEKDTICDSLYICYGNNPNIQSYGSLWRYQDSNNTIRIDSTQALNIPTQDIISYQKVTVKTWRITKYTQNGRIFSSSMQAPTIQAPTDFVLSDFVLGDTESRTLGATDGGFDPGSPGGDTYVPGKSIQTAAPSRGSESQQTFGSISDIDEDDRNNTVLGAVVFYFFVFKDHEAANRVINVLNSPNPNAIG